MDPDETKGDTMRRALLISVVVSGCVFGQKASVAVLNPEKPENMSEGEIGVMLDAVTREISKNPEFVALDLKQMQPVLKEKGVERVNACPDKTCLRDIGAALSVDYVATLTLERKGQPFLVNLKMFDIESGHAIAEAGGEYNGPKSQLVLKFIPKQAKELARGAAPIAAKKATKKGAPAAVKEEPPVQPTVEVEEKPAEAGVEKSAPAPRQPGPAGKKTVFQSPAFWIPAVVVVAVPVAVIYYVRKNRDEETEKPGDEMQSPPYPQRPTATAVKP